MFSAESTKRQFHVFDHQVDTLQPNRIIRR